MDRQKTVEEAGMYWQNGHLRQELAEASEKLADLVKVTGRLREALRPFAWEAKHWHTYSDDEPVVEAFPGYEGNITVGDLRAAYMAYMNLMPNEETP